MVNISSGGGFPDMEENEKKAPDWFTRFSMEGLSFFLFARSLQKPRREQEKEMKMEKTYE